MVCWMIRYCYYFLFGFKCTFQLYCSAFILYIITWIQDTGTMRHCALVSCTPSQPIGLVLGGAVFWGWVSLGAVFTIYLIEFYFILIFIMKVTIIGIFMAILYFSNNIFRLSVATSFWFCKLATPWMFTPLHILLENWIEHVTFRLLYVMFIFPTRIIYRGVTGFATDCPCGIWCHGLTTCLLYVGLLFGNLV